MLTNLLIKPVITEKAMLLSQSGQFTFFVRKNATKSSIKNQIENHFKVNVLKVRILSKPGKIKRSGKKRLPSQTQSFKKTLVTLKPGQTIDYFKLPDEGKSHTNKKKDKKEPKKVQKDTPKAKPTKKGFFGLGKRKAQRTQDK